MSQSPAYFMIPNWRRVQSYKDRNPTWINVFTMVRKEITREALINGISPPTDVEMCQIIFIWILAATHDQPKKDSYKNGPKLPCDPSWIKKETDLDSTPDLDRITSLGGIVCYTSTGTLLQARACACTTEQREQREIENSTSSLSGKPDYIGTSREVISYLNQKAGTKFKPKAKATMKFVTARIKDGYTIEDMKRVIDAKCEEWLGGEFQKYLRPETLFNATKFESYYSGLTDESGGGWAERRAAK